MKDLGVFAARDLLWNSLINTLVSECNNIMGMIQSSVGYAAPIIVTSYLHNAFTL